MEQACSSRANEALATIGIGLIGTLVGYKLGKAGGAVVGGMLGGIVGNLIGRDVDERRCQIAKISQAAGTKVTYAPILVAPPGAMPAISPGQSAPATRSQPSTEQKSTSETLGQVSRWSDAAFASGSSELTDKAKNYFSQLAKLYLPQPPSVQQMANMSPQEKQTYLTYVNTRNTMPILLIGNTDDVGDSAANQKLSEARSRAVGEIFRANGIDPARIYYWGAGETRPVADNRTEEGRTDNRRVDVMDFQDVEALNRYLKIERPVLAYYRPVEPSTSQAEHKPTSSEPPKQAWDLGHETTGAHPSATSSPTEPEPKVAENAAPTPAPQIEKHQKKAGPHVNSPFGLDFGGTPATAQMPSLFDQLGGTKTASVFFGLVSTAHAAEPPIASCMEDRARRGGRVINLATNKPVESYNSADFLPGMNNTPWGATLNGHMVALSSVAVIRDDARSVSDPQIEIFKDYAKLRNKSKARPTYTLNTSVNTYEGRDGFLYRIFVTDDKGPVSCIDLAVPYSGQKAENGRMNYTIGNVEYAVAFPAIKL